MRNSPISSMAAAFVFFLQHLHVNRLLFELSVGCCWLWLQVPQLEVMSETEPDVDLVVVARHESAHVQAQAQAALEAVCRRRLNKRRKRLLCRLCLLLPELVRALVGFSVHGNAQPYLCEHVLPRRA